MICELVGVYILHVLVQKYGKESVGLYRDDDLTCFENVSGPQAGTIRKDVIKIFKQEFHLNITFEINLKIVDFLDITLNLSTSQKFLAYLLFFMKTNLSQTSRKKLNYLTIFL